MNIKFTLAAAAIAAMGVVGASSDAKAITWTLTDVPLTDGGTLSGTFSINVDGYLAGYNLTTTIGSELFSESYFSPPPVAPNINTTSPPIAGNVVDFFPNDNPAIGALQLTFANSLSTPGTDNIVIGDAASFECLGSYSCQFTGQTNVFGYGGGPTYSPLTRYIGSGDATATPLPSTWTMLIAGFVGLGFFAYRGSKHVSATLAAA
jgi:hypothetical protein